MADAGLGGCGVVLVDAGAGSDVAGHGVVVVGLSSLTFATNSVDDVVSLGADALS